MKRLKRPRPKYYVALLCMLPIAAEPLLAQVASADLTSVESPMAARSPETRLLTPLTPVQLTPVQVAAEGTESFGGRSVVEAADNAAPVGLPQQVRRHYRYDDRGFEVGVYGGGYITNEVAQRFRLPRNGVLAYIEGCFGIGEGDEGGPDHAYLFSVYSDQNGSPGRELARTAFNVEGKILERVSCFREFLQVPLPSGDIWVAAYWERYSSYPPIENKLLAADSNGIGDTKVLYRGGLSEYDGDVYGPWRSYDSDVQAVGIRIGVDHEDESSGYTNCFPVRDALYLSGVYAVSMCYQTPDGRVGHARPVDFSSRQSGLLWFFDPDNAEVLIKVLDGCRDNGYYWVFVAPVTDVAFNLYVTDRSSGLRWTHRNRQGVTAATKSDTSAFRCN